MSEEYNRELGVDTSFLSSNTHADTRRYINRHANRIRSPCCCPIALCTARCLDLPASTFPALPANPLTPLSCLSLSDIQGLFNLLGACFADQSARGQVSHRVSITRSNISVAFTILPETANPVDIMRKCRSDPDNAFNHGRSSAFDSGIRQPSMTTQYL
jgi:hypothetical protein